jgi:hypothetical protein
MARLDGIGVWAQHVWRSPDGNEHPQWSGPDDPRLCRCGERHTLADAPARLICPGVAHFEGVRPCVLCGLGWRVPRVVQIDVPPLPGSEMVRAAIFGSVPAITGAGFLSAPAIPGAGPGVILMDLDAPPPAPAPRCVYCMTLEGKTAALAHHYAEAHSREDH